MGVSPSKGVVMLDTSRKVFLSPSCFNDKKTLDYILKDLKEHHQVPENRIIKEVNISVLNSGDYLIRCFSDVIHLFKVELSPQAGFTTHFIDSL